MLESLVRLSQFHNDHSRRQPLRHVLSTADRWIYMGGFVPSKSAVEGCYFGSCGNQVI
jgi:hypothetical protein